MAGDDDVTPTVDIAPLPPPSRRPHTYKRTCLITCATDNVNRQLALELATRSRDNFVIVHGRTRRHCEALVAEIAVDQKCATPVNVDYVIADFADAKQVSRQNDAHQSRLPLDRRHGRGSIAVSVTAEPCLC